MLKMLYTIPDWFWIFFTSMIPWWEGRYSIVLAMVKFGWSWLEAIPLVLIGNFLPIPFILLLFKHVERWLRNFRYPSKLMDWLFSKTRKKASEKIERYKYLGLLLFIAVPLPFTGAWTGALIAYLFNLNFSKSLLTIFLGTLIAVLIMIILTIAFGNVFGYKF